MIAAISPAAASSSAAGPNPIMEPAVRVVPLAETPMVGALASAEVSVLAAVSPPTLFSKMAQTWTPI